MRDGPWDVRGVRGMYAAWSVGCTCCTWSGICFYLEVKLLINDPINSPLKRIQIWHIMPKFRLKIKQILSGLQKYNFYNTIFACKRISNQASNLNPYDFYEC